MGLLDEIAAEKRYRGSVCHVKITLAEAPPEITTDLRVAIDDHETSANAIVRALRARGYSALSAGTIGRHRRGDCACGLR